MSFKRLIMTNKMIFFASDINNVVSAVSNDKCSRMDKIFKLAGSEIKVGFEPQLIRVYSDRALWQFLAGDIQAKMKLLVYTIKEEYFKLFQRKLEIRDDSLVVEILVHVYCDYVGLLFNRVVQISWLRRLVIKLLKRAEIVDCGERQVDSNRWIWDFLARFSRVFIAIIPQNLNKRKLK
jgi:hypothetical protein